MYFIFQPQASDTENTVILLVDDDTDILETCQSALEENGFHVIPCSSGQEAIHAFHTYQEEINTVITDFNMPGINGLELIQNLSMHQPCLKTILISGNYFGDLPNNITLLSKPFTFDALMLAIRQ